MKRFWRLKPSQKIAIGYFGVAVVGAVLLLLPIAHRVHVGFTDAMFTSASALYVTGLSTVTTSTTWTPLGDFIIALLIQVGGSGITLITTGLYLIAGRKIPLGTRLLMAEDRNFSVRGIVRLYKNILYFSFGIEGLATVLFAVYFHFRLGYTWLRAAAVAAFHSISSFNNAGFDLWGNSLDGFPKDPFIVILTGLLIILGGLGFIVLAELYSYPRHKSLTLHTRIVLRVSAWLLVIGTVLILFFEATGSMQNLSWPYKVLNAWFASVTTRTAGFESIPISHMHQITWVIMTILMFIGASPGSTGGGIKTTTFFLILKNAIATTRGDAEIVSGERSIPWSIAQRAMLIFLLSMGVVMVGTLIDAAVEPHIQIIRIIFEEVSAFGTVGLTTGITPIVASPMKWVLIFTMYVGRIGILTFLVSVMQRPVSKVRHVEERILIG